MDTEVRDDRLIFVDEGWSLLNSSTDPLKEKLREVKEVPNASYLVSDGKVFVFQKLIALVQANKVHHTDTALADIACSLLPQAFVPAKEAVETWGVVPEPYELENHQSGGFIIRHRRFNATLPAVFPSKLDAQAVLADLLVGGAYPGEGDFVFHGQPMTLCEPLEIKALPQRPLIETFEVTQKVGYTALGRSTYMPGFDPVTETLFNDVKTLDAQWASNSHAAAQYTQKHIETLWSRAAELQLDTLSNASVGVPEYGHESFAKLRLLYPELSMVGDGSLYALFDMYQAECCYLNGWTPDRDDDFLFYLVGKVAFEESDHQAMPMVGRWVAYAFLRNESMESACSFGRAAQVYGTALTKLAHRIADVMQYLECDEKNGGQRGRPITTMMDMFTWGRKQNIRLVSNQNLTDALDAAGKAE